MLDWDYCHEKAGLPTYFWQKVALSCRKSGRRFIPHAMKLPQEGARSPARQPATKALSLN
jgi:hypothetical protein